MTALFHSEYIDLCDVFNIYIFHRFYVGCERCPEWFHGRCVGIMQAEASGTGRLQVNLDLKKKKLENGLGNAIKKTVLEGYS